MSLRSQEAPVVTHRRRDGVNDKTSQALQYCGTSKGASTSVHHQWPIVPGLRPGLHVPLTMDVVTTDQRCGTLKPPH